MKLLTQIRRRYLFGLPLVAALCLSIMGTQASALTAEDASPEAPAIDFDILFGPKAGGNTISSVTWHPNNQELAFSYSDSHGKDAYWLLDIQEGTKRSLLPSDLDLGQNESGENKTVDGYHFMPDGKNLLIDSGGDLFVYQVASQAVRRVTTEQQVKDGFTLAPDGKHVAFAQDSDLFVLDLETGEQTALTQGGGADGILNGTNSWVYWEEIWGRSDDAFWWSPDGGSLAYLRTDESQVERYPLIRTGEQYPTVEWQPYPKAGTTNPTVKVGVKSLSGGDTVWLQTGHEDGYIGRVGFLPSSQQVAVQRLNRDQNQLDVLSCSVDTGQCKTLLTESWKTWINLGDELTFLGDGKFIWSSERTGWKSLYLHDANGKQIKRLSPADVAVTSLDGVDEASGRLIFSGFSNTALGAASRQVYTAYLDDPLTEIVSPLDGWSSAQVSPDASAWVHGWSDANTPTTHVVRNFKGELLQTLPSAGPSAYDASALPQWELFDVPGDGSYRLPVSMLKPAGFDPTKKYPVIMYHYGCPASQVVNNRWGGRSRGLWHKMMAERGYIIFSLDNRGSTFFGKRGEDLAYRRFGEGNLKAQLSGVEYLKSLDYVDADRVGIWGWSGGGSNTLYLLLKSPGTWAAGVAGAPVTDWTLYDTIWTERYLDHPSDNPEGYHDSSPVTYADQLADPLLLVHGTGDDNVHPQNSIVMMDAFIKANVPFEEAIYPSQKHGFVGASSRHFYERMTKFFDTHLLAADSSKKDAASN